MSMFLAALGLSVVLLGGCATTTYWNPSPDAQAFDSAVYQCKRDGMRIYGYDPDPGFAAEQQILFRQCMNAKGWYREDKR